MKELGFVGWKGSCSDPFEEPLVFEDFTKWQLFTPAQRNAFVVCSLSGKYSGVPIKELAAAAGSSLKDMDALVNEMMLQRVVVTGTASNGVQMVRLSDLIVGSSNIQESRDINSTVQVGIIGYDSDGKPPRGIGNYLPDKVPDDIAVRNDAPGTPIWLGALIKEDPAVASDRCCSLYNAKYPHADIDRAKRVVVDEVHGKTKIVYVYSRGPSKIYPMSELIATQNQLREEFNARRRRKIGKE